MLNHLETNRTDLLLLNLNLDRSKDARVNAIIEVRRNHCRG